MGCLRLNFWLSAVIDNGEFIFRWHDEASPNETSLVISTLDYEPLWSVCPKVKTDQWILGPKYFLSLDVASQPILSLFGDLMTILNFQTLIIICGQCVPICNTYAFLLRKKLSKFKLSTYYIAEVFAYKILQYNTQKVCKPKYA